MPTVAVFSTHFLEYSQTFVHDELRSHERYDAEVFCKKRLNADRFPFAKVHVASRLYGITRSDRTFDALLSSGRFALVHAHFGPGGVYALRYAEKFRLPLVVTFHGYDVPLLSSAERFFPETVRYAIYAPKLLRSMTLGLCASEELREMLVRHGVPAERLSVHSLGVDIEQFRPDPGARRTNDALRVAMIGRFVEKKGFEFGLRAFAELGASGVELVLAGDGELRSRLQRLARSLGVEKRVRFLGVLKNQEISDLLRRTDILLAPSVVARRGDRESGPIVIKEACASGVVPIATRHGGIPEIVEDGVTGFLVPERDVKALSEKLGVLARDAALRTKMGGAARSRVAERFELRERVRALETRYDEAIAVFRDSSTRGGVG